jgi:plasmid stability protein
MSAVTIRNLPEETHRALRARAAQHGRSTEAEIREILELAVRPVGRVKLGSLLAAIGREAGLTDRDVDLLQNLRDKTAVVPVSFE